MIYRFMVVVCVCVCVCVCISCPHMHPILKSQTYEKAILMLVVYKFHHFYFDGKAVTVWEELGSLKNEYVKKKYWRRAHRLDWQ